MNLNIEAKEAIKRNSTLLYGAMKRMYRYTFTELQRLCRLSDTDLCLAIVCLLQQGRVRQGKDEEGVCYMAETAMPAGMKKEEGVS